MRGPSCYSNPNRLTGSHWRSKKGDGPAGTWRGSSDQSEGSVRSQEAGPVRASVPEAQRGATDKGAAEVHAGRE